MSHSLSWTLRGCGGHDSISAVGSRRDAPTLAVQCRSVGRYTVAESQLWHAVDFTVFAPRLLPQRSFRKARSTVLDSPLFVSYLMPIYNIGLNASDNLVLDVETMAQLMHGEILFWDDVVCKRAEL